LVTFLLERFSGYYAVYFKDIETPERLAIEAEMIRLQMVFEELWR